MSEILEHYQKRLAQLQQANRLGTAVERDELQRLVYHLQSLEANDPDDAATWRSRLRQSERATRMYRKILSRMVRTERKLRRKLKRQAQNQEDLRLLMDILDLDSMPDYGPDVLDAYHRVRATLEEA